MTSEKKGSTTADFLAALDTPLRKPPGTVCGVTRILDSLDQEVRTKVLSIIEELRAARETGAKTEYTSAWLARTLTDHGYKVSELTVGIHVRKGCRCE